jgi:hypothetical protein
MTIVHPIDHVIRSRFVAVGQKPEIVVEDHAKKNRLLPATPRCRDASKLRPPTFQGSLLGVMRPV